MTTACYFFAYLFETLISFIYFDHKFERKLSYKKCFIVYSLSFLVQYAVSYMGIPNLNLSAFLLCNFLFCFICFDADALQSALNSILLASIMLVTELCILYVFRIVFGIDVTAHTSNSTVLLLQSICTKLFYFFVSFIILKLSSKEDGKSFRVSKSFLLFLLPLASIILLLGIVYVTEKYPAEDNVYRLFSISAVLLLYSNIVVFWIHEQTIKTQKENMNLQLQKQKSEIDTEYYAVLQEQYENSNILIHDIKRHLLSIKELSAEKDFTAINNYIDNLYQSYQIKRIKKYSDNKLVNAIINRYAALCDEKQISFYCDIRNIDFSFISDNNLTAVLDNMLDNAVTAAEKSDKKNIEFTIKPINTNFIVINMENSSSCEPKIKNGKLVTTKENKAFHGFGIKSIHRIAKEYDGNIDYNFDKEKMVFKFSVVLKII